MQCHHDRAQHKELLRITFAGVRQQGQIPYAPVEVCITEWKHRMKDGFDALAQHRYAAKACNTSIKACSSESLLDG